MPATSPDATHHPFDDATRVTAGDSRWTGHTSDDYWAFVGPFGGITAATLLRAIIEHPQRLGDALSLTVNFCARSQKARSIWMFVSSRQTARRSIGLWS